MGEPKPTASLSSGLLARKGAARPAMRRQGLGGIVHTGHDDLGWNDMGYDVDPGPESEPDHRIADITPMLTPIHARSGDADEHQETEAPTRSPLSVKPGKAGKPPVVLQREQLEDKVRQNAPAREEPEAVVHELLEAPVVDATPVIEVVPAFAEVSAFEDAAVVAEVPLADVAPIAISDPEIAAPKPIRAPAKRAPGRRSPAARPSGAKAAFTLRIDADRHLRLRLASALTNFSAQQILTEALDDYLESLPEVEALATNVGRHATAVKEG